MTGTDWKNRQLSQTSEATMPIVVRMATTEQAMKIAEIQRSTCGRAA